MDDLDAAWDDLTTFVEERMEALGVPGVAVGIIHADATRTAGFGVTNVDHPLPVTPTTRFQIGSITKTFTGTAAMRLVEQGKLDLDATVRTYLPEFRVQDEEASENATLRHLLTHTGGWVGDFFHDTGAGDDALERYVADMADLEQLAPLGRHFSYCNSGFIVLGRILEVVTGDPFADVLQELVLDPLGLESATLDPGEVMLGRFAVGHEASDDGAKVTGPWPLPVNALAAGGVTCNVKDLLRYGRFHLRDGTTEDGERILQAASLEAMHEPEVPIWGGDAWGLSWAVRDLGGTRIVGHDGATAGQAAWLILVPSERFALAVLTNAGTGGRLGDDTSRLALRRFLGVDDPVPEPRRASLKELAPFAGRYRNPQANLDVGFVGDALVGRYEFTGHASDEDDPTPPPSPPFALDLCDEDRLVILDGPLREWTFEVVRREDGSVGWIRAGRLHRRVDEEA